jgi:phosphoglycerate kinase
MKNIKDVNIDGKRVLVRVDFNVPLDEHLNITDDARIRSVLPTLKYVLDHHSKLIIMSHLGRPKGAVNPKMSLSPVSKRLEGLLQTKVGMAKDSIGSEVESLVGKMKEGDVVLLENLRFHPEEQKNDDAFAQKLAGLCDVFVNDAFAVSHRINASVVAVTKYAPVSVAGFLLQQELDYFQKAMTDPQRPLAAIIGGAKVSGKLDALKNMLHHVDKFIIGGAMANTFLKSAGYNMEKSMVEPDLVETAASIMKKAIENGIKFYIPVDAVAASRFDAQAEIRTVPVQEIPKNWMIMDIGPASIMLYSEALEDAGTIIWNGPMGVFEMDAFSRGTSAIVRSVANSQALSIVGGGDTGAAVHSSGESGKITYISTGGGAFLALMEGKTLPGVAALDG